MVIVHRNLCAGRVDDQCCDDDGGDPGRRNGVYRGPAVPGIRWSGHIVDLDLDRDFSRVAGRGDRAADLAFFGQPVTGSFEHGPDYLAYQIDPDAALATLAADTGVQPQVYGVV